MIHPSGNETPGANRAVPWVFLVPVLWWWAGCAELEPMVEPEVADLQLTIDALKTAVRDAQRTIAELRGELEARRKELGEAQVARAQLEGKLRETERRLAEAKHVIDLQREELAAARNERERIARAGQQLQAQLRHLQRQLAQHSKLLQESGVSAPAAASRNVSRSPVGAEPASLPDADPYAIPFPNTSTAGAGNRRALEPELPALPRTVTVQAGDTLWSLSRRYRVSLAELRALNNLRGNRIEPGQALWLPDAGPATVPGFSGNGAQVP
ncbi:MAG TPA: LysM peptidoglycan-binding domain-containing protein [Nitrospiraceae bacterium]|jgi:LysM repeat protein|nr:LysM peptidoglycan-binding domain-containing protein [Nitrospiraceae bacterium]